MRSARMAGMQTAVKHVLTTPGLRKSYSGRQHIAPRDEVAEADDRHVARSAGRLSLTMFADAYLFRWLRWDDEIATVEQAKQQHLTTYNNVAVISALMLVVSLEMLLQTPELPAAQPTFLISVYFYSFVFAFCMLSFATINCVLLVLALHKTTLSRPHILFVKLFDPYQIYPILQFYLGMIGSGLGTLTWILINAPPTRGLVGATIFCTIAFVFNAYFYHTMLASLFVAIKTHINELDEERPPTPPPIRTGGDQMFNAACGTTKSCEV